MSTFAEKVSEGVKDVSVCFSNSASEKERFDALQTASLLSSEACKVQKISFSGEADAELWIKMLKGLQGNVSVHSLDFLACPFPEDVWPHLLSAIEKKEGLQNLSVRRCVPGEDCPRKHELVSGFVACIASHGKALERLTLSQMDLGAAAADSIPSVIEKCTKLELFELDDNGLSKEQLKAIDAAMAHNPKIVVTVPGNLEPPVTRADRSSFRFLDIAFTGRRERSEFSLVETLQAISREIERTVGTEGDDTSLRGPQPACAAHEITDLQQRLGLGPLPPSYLQFLEFSNGWGRVFTEVPSLRPARRVQLYSAENKRRLAAILSGAGYDDAEEEEEEGQEEEEDLSEEDVRVMRRAVQISDMEDSEVLLLVPPPQGKGDSEAGGEWEAWKYAKHSGARRFSNFRELLLSLLATLRTFSSM